MNLKICVLKDRLRRFHFKRKERRVLALKWALNFLHNSKFIREFNFDEGMRRCSTQLIYKSITYSKANTSVTRIRNRCRICHRARGSVRVFRMFRSSLLEEFKVTQRFVGLSRALYSKPSKHNNRT